MPLNHPSGSLLSPFQGHGTLLIAVWELLNGNLLASDSDCVAQTQEDLSELSQPLHWSFQPQRLGPPA